MDKIRACVGDLVAVANSVASHDLSEARRRLELLFAEAGGEPGGSSSTVQKVRDQLAQSVDKSHGTAAKQFLSELITWLDSEHLGRGT